MSCSSLLMFFELKKLGKILSCACARNEAYIKNFCERLCWEHCHIENRFFVLLRDQKQITC